MIMRKPFKVTSLLLLLTLLLPVVIATLSMAKPAEAG